MRPHVWRNPTGSWWVTWDGIDGHRYNTHARSWIVAIRKANRIAWQIRGAK